MLLEQNASPTYAFSLVIESLHWDVGHACGLSRTLIKKLRGCNAWENRGADDERIDAEGALAEVLVAMLLDKAPNITIAPLVAHMPDAGGVDITIDGKRLDVKSIGRQSRSSTSTRSSTPRRTPACTSWFSSRAPRWRTSMSSAATPSRLGS